MLHACVTYLSHLWDSAVRVFKRAEKEVPSARFSPHGVLSAFFVTLASTSSNFIKHSMLLAPFAPLALLPAPLHAVTHARSLPCMSGMSRRAALGAGAAAAFVRLPAHASEEDYSAVAAELASMIKADPDVGPTLLRLAWHSSGTFDKISKTGGSKGGTIRFKEELAHGGNAGLHKLVDRLEPLKARYPDVSYADMYTLAGKVAIESAGGPQISWREPTPVPPAMHGPWRGCLPCRPCAVVLTPRCTPQVLGGSMTRWKR